MSIQLISKEHHENLVALFDEAEYSIKIISPFVGSEMANLLTTLKHQNPELDIKMITRFYSGDFILGVSQIRALKDLHESGVEIYALKGLHTKLYLIDSDVGLLGSANFTSGGFKFNHELSLKVVDEPEINRQMQTYFDELVNAILGQGTEYLLTLDKIEQEIKYVTKKLELDRNKSVTYKYGKFGAELPTYDFNSDGETTKQDEDLIQKFISQSLKPRNSKSLTNDGITIWLKFVGVTDSRFSLDEKYQPQIEKGYPAGITCYPTNKKPSSVSAGDLIYIAAVSMDEKDHPVLPYIVGRGKTAGFNPNNIATQEMLKNNEWMVRYQNFCAFTEYEYIDATIGECIPLVEVLHALHSDTYVSTEGEHISMDKLRKRHTQKAHIRITATAKDFIDNAFEGVAKKYGVHKLTIPTALSAQIADIQHDRINTITGAMIETVYGVAKMVYDGTITKVQGEQMAFDQSGMKQSSASYYIDGFVGMREGKKYMHTLNEEGTRYYFKRIYYDFGDEGLRRALEATRKHLEYYESRPTGGSLPGIQKIINEFAQKLI